ncbi:hypothetical protein IAT38_002962 [Cryptococcus sp. DSM 104549]
MGEVIPPPSRRPPFQYKPYIPGSYRITPPTSTPTSTTTSPHYTQRQHPHSLAQARRNAPYPTSPASSSASVSLNKPPPALPISQTHAPSDASAPPPRSKPNLPPSSENQYVPRLPPPLIHHSAPVLPYATARHMVPRGHTTLPKSPPKREAQLDTYDDAPPDRSPHSTPLPHVRPDPPGVIRTKQGFVHPKPNLPTESLLAIAHPSTPRPRTYHPPPVHRSTSTPSSSGKAAPPQALPSPYTPYDAPTPNTPSTPGPPASAGTQHQVFSPFAFPDGVGVPYGAVSIRGGGLVGCACPHSHKDQPNVRGVPQPPDPAEAEREKVPGYVKQCITRVQSNKAASLGHMMCSWCMGRENHVRSYFDRLVSEGQPDRLCWLYARYELERREAVAARDVNTDPRVSMSLRWQTYATAHKSEQITKEQIMEYFRKAREMGIVF